MIYIISCGVESCPCGEPRGGCERGFFSLFIQVVYGIAFAQKKQIPYYVDFGSCTYPYSDPQRGEQNFWNYYFKQPFLSFPTKGKLISNFFIEVYPLRIWDRRHFIQMHHNVVSGLQFNKEVQDILNAKIVLFKRNRVLGVQIRRTDHAKEVLPVSLEKIISRIDNVIHKYNFLFIATDDSGILELLKKKYGEKLLYNEAERSENEIAIHANKFLNGSYKLGLEVLIDCYCLSSCKHALLLHSNVSYAALLFNPFLSYTLLERSAERYKRLKTILLYYLDKYGIRKW